MCITAQLRWLYRNASSEGAYKTVSINCSNVMPPFEEIIAFFEAIKTSTDPQELLIDQEGYFGIIKAVSVPDDFDAVSITCIEEHKDGTQTSGVYLRQDVIREFVTAFSWFLANSYDREHWMMADYKEVQDLLKLNLNAISDITQEPTRWRNPTGNNPTFEGGEAPNSQEIMK